MQQPRGLVKLRPSVSTYSFFELAARVAAHSVAVRTRNGSNAAFLQTLAPANTDFSLRFPPVRIMKVSPEKKNSKRKKLASSGQCVSCSGTRMISFVLNALSASFAVQAVRESSSSL